MIKTLAIVFMGLVLLTNLALAQVDLPIGPDDATNAGLCAGGEVRDCVFDIFSIVFKALIYISGALAVIMFIWAGVSLILKPDFTVAKERLIWGAVGLIIALVSYAIVQLIAKFTQTGGLG